MPNFIALVFLNKINGDRLVLKVYASGDMLVSVNDKYSSLEGLNWNVAAIVKKFPDLANQEPSVIKQEGLKRFKKSMLGLLTWETKKNNLINSLKPYGYIFQQWISQEGRVIKNPTFKVEFVTESSQVTDDEVSKVLGR